MNVLFTRVRARLAFLQCGSPLIIHVDDEVEGTLEVLYLLSVGSVNDYSNIETVEVTKPERLYPDHLYDAVRRRIALELIEKEFNKQLSAAGAANIDTAKWMQRFDDHTFWNAVEGFMGGTLIKPIVHFLTARNYTWSRRVVPVSEIKLSSKLEQLERLLELNPHELYLSRINELLGQDKNEAAKQKEINDSFSQNDAQNKYLPLIVVSDGHPMVIDGNRRCLRALLYGQETVEAWYCQTNDEEPVDFWFPIDDMMGLLRIYRYGKERNPQLKVHIAGILKELFRQSKVAEIAYRERIVAHNTKGAEELLEFIDI